MGRGETKRISPPHRRTRAQKGLRSLTGGQGEKEKLLSPSGGEDEGEGAIGFIGILFRPASVKLM
jgi:hypothetical protein